MRTLGVIGAGGIAQKMHLPALAALDSVRLAWVTDSNSEQARRTGEAYHISSAPLPQDLRELPEADVILLAIPYGVRPPYYDVLRHRSSAIYVEKPFARAVEEHRQLCGWFGDFRFGGGFQRRTWAPTQMLRRLVDEELFGSLREIRFGFGRLGATSGGAHPDIRLSGGGMLFESAIHGIDAALFVSRAVQARALEVDMIADQGFDLHTSAAFEVTTERGRSVHCEFKVSCLEETENFLRLRFDHADVSLALFGDGVVEVRSPGGKGIYRIDVPPYPLSSYETAHEHWRRFLEGLDAAQPNWTSAADSLLTSSVIEQLYASARS